MKLFTAILLVAAFVLFVLAAALVPDPQRARLIAAGLACLTLAWLIPNWPG